MTEAPAKSSFNALVTGATGFTGGHLALALKNRGYNVRALVRPGSNVGKLERHGINLYQGNLTSPHDVERSIDSVDLVFHIGALFRTAGNPDSYYYDVNVKGTQNVLNAAEKHQVQRIVHCSTVGVHGAVKEVPSNEDSPFSPGDIYQETKLAGERVAQQAISDGLPVVVVRPAGIYGPGDLRFLKLFKTIHKRRFRMFGSGEVFYHLTYIDDLVEGIILCGEKPEAVGRTYILAGEQHATLNELVRLVAAAVRVPPPRRHLPLWPLMTAARLCESICRPLAIEPPLHRRRAEFFVKDRAFSIKRAKRELGFQPRVDLQEGLNRTARWYFENGYL